MQLPEMLSALARLPDHVGSRPRGILVVVTARGQVMKLGRNGPHTWAPMLSDLIAMDWQIFSPEQMKQAAELAAAAAGEESGDHADG